MRKILVSIALLLALLLALAQPARANVPCSLPFNLQNGVTADATQVMANYNALVTCLANAAIAGANNDITSLLSLSTPLTPAQGGSTVYYAGTSTGSANAQVVSAVTPTGFTLTIGKRINFTAGFDNTGALQINVNNTGLTNVFVMAPGGPQALIGGEVRNGNRVEAVFDGTQFQLLSVQNQFGGFGASASVASAATTDLSLLPAHFGDVTGTTTITSFGANASIAFPVYLVQFTGSLLLTNNNTSLILPNSTSITTQAGDQAFLRYLGSGNWKVMDYYRASGQPLYVNPTPIRNYIGGLTMSTAGSSATFSVAAGTATDSTNVASMVLASAYTKTTSSWAVGSGNGCLDTGAIATGQYYHVFLIQRLDTGVTDLLCSLSVASPTLPTNYTLFRRLGSMRTDGSSHWLKFIQVGGEFMWDVPFQDSNLSGAGPNAGITVSTPPGVSSIAHMEINCRSTGGTILVSSPLTSQGVSVPGGNATCAGASSSQDQFTPVSAITSTFPQVGVASTGGGSTYTFTLVTTGWYDFRGQQ